MGNEKEKHTGWKLKDILALFHRFLTIVPLGVCDYMVMWCTKKVTWINTIVKWALVNGQHLLNFLKVKAPTIYEPDDQ